MATTSRLRRRGIDAAATGSAETATEQGDAELDDDELVAAARENPEAFAALYERYVRPVYRFCYVRLGAAQEAEDATSKIFSRALAGLPGLHKSFVSWLFAIARNTVIDMLRARRPAQPLDAATDPPDSAPSPEDETVARAEAETLRKALDRLPEMQRLAVELQLAGWTGPQIATVLGKSPQAVKMLRFRALRRLRAVLRPVAEQDEEVPYGRA